MFGIGIPELVLILIVGLIVFGPGKLPEVGRAVGKGLREFRKASSALQAVLNEPDPPAKPTQQPAQNTQPAAPQQPETAGTAQTPTAEAPAPAAADTGAAAPTVPTDVPYTPPTQESVRQSIDAQKKEV